MQDRTWRFTMGCVAGVAAAASLATFPTTVRAALLGLAAVAVGVAIWIPWQAPQRAALQAIRRRPSATPTWAYRLQDHRFFPGPHTRSRLPTPDEVIGDDARLDAFDAVARRAAQGEAGQWTTEDGRGLRFHVEPGAYRGFVTGWTEDATTRLDATATTMRLVRGLPVAACVVDRDNRVVAHSEAWTGQGQAAEGDLVHAGWPAAQAEELAGRIGRCLQHQRYDAFSLRIHGIPLAMQVAPVEIDGQMCAVVTADPRDDVEHLQRSLDATRARLQGVIDGCPIPLVLHDADGHVLGWSPAATRQFGWTSEEAVGRLVPTPAPGHGDPEEWIRRALTRNIMGERVMRTDRDGRLLSVEAYTAPTKDEQGRRRGFVALYLDPSDREKAQRQAQEIEDLRGADALKTTFLSTAAHELGTPLTPLKLQLRTLQSTATEAQKPGFEMLERNVSRMERLVRDILDAAKLESRRLAIEKRSVDVDKLLKGVSAIFEKAAEDQDVHLVVEPADGTIEGDPIRLDQVMTNLVSNALKFTPAGGEVRIRASSTPQAVTITVRDNGAGMTAEQTADVFRPFTQFHRKQTGAHIGTGLGMFISHGIVAAHGGRMECHSDGPGTGTTFTIHLPRHHAGALEGPALDVRR